MALIGLLQVLFRAITFQGMSLALSRSVIQGQCGKFSNVEAMRFLGSPFFSS
jgi:hypothetical protein